MKKQFIVFFILLIAVIPISLSGQRYLRGRITDTENDKPIPGASVFISNTTIGTTTDTEGYYQLSIPEEGSYRLTISHVGYQSVFRDIEPGNVSMVINIAMNIIELEEITVSARVRFRQKDINLFWRTILGESPSRKTIHVLNPEVVYFYYNSETKKLKVTCREPLQIVNYETGYRIHYVLNSFTHDYNENDSDWSNQLIFSELKPENIRQKIKWEDKRRKLYSISLTKFIKSLYNNSLHNEGFVLVNFHQKTGSDNPYQISLLDSESILSKKSPDNSRTLSLYDKQVMIICYGSPITVDDLNIIQHTPNEIFIRNRVLCINLLKGNSIRIFPNGTYANRLIISPVNLSSTLLGLNMRLPFEYLPE